MISPKRPHTHTHTQTDCICVYTEFKVEEMKDYMYTAEATIRDELSVCVCDRQGDRERERVGVVRTSCF